MKTSSTFEEAAADHRPDYVAELREAREKADPLALAVCQEWHGAKFGWPGYGAAPFVRSELEKAEKAVKVFRASKS
jgi:hypothetical protein